MINKELFKHKTTALLALTSLLYITFAARVERNKRIKESRNYLCGGCGADCRLEVHHIIPLSLDGTNDDSNLIALGVSISEGGCGCHDEWDKEALS